MAKHTFKIGSSAADAEPGGGGYYDGPKPPPGVYVVEIKFIRIKVNKNGDDMLNVLCEIAEPKGAKAQYNGYAIWDNLNVVEDNAGRVNQLLDAMGVNRKSFWPPNGPTVDNNDPPNITKIGTKRPEGVKVRIATKDGEWNGEERLERTRYLALKAAEEEAEEAEDEEAEDTEAEEAEVEEEETEEVEEEEAEGDGDDEPLTKEDLMSYDTGELQEICDAWEIPYTAKTSKSLLIKKILEAQEAAAAAEEEEAEEEEAEEESEEEEGYTEEYLKEQDLAELKRILTEEFEGALPKPPIKPRLIKAVLNAQAEMMGNEPPF